MKRFFLIVLTTALIFLPAMLFAQTEGEPEYAYNIVITPITYEQAELVGDSTLIYDSIINEFGWQGQLQSLYRLIQTSGSIGDPPSLANLPPDAQAVDPRYVLTVNLYIDGADRVITMNLYNTPNFDLVGNQEMAYKTVEEALGMLAFFCWSLSSNLPPVDRPAPIVTNVEPEIIYVTPEEDIIWKNKWLYLGLEGGLSFRLYKSTKESDANIFTAGTTFNAGLRLEVQFVHFMLNTNYFSFSFETGTDITREGMDWKDYTVTGEDIVPLSVTGEGSSGLNLSLPGLLKFNYKPGIFATSLYGGVYFILPLDESKYSPPVGITAGLNAGVKLGPGLLYIDFQYGLDLGPKEFHYTATLSSVPLERDVVYGRQMFTLALGYKFGFLDRPDRRKAKEEPAVEEETTEEPAVAETTEEPAVAEGSEL